MRKTITIISVGALLAGCTIHPQGERSLRDEALKAGEPYEANATAQSLPQNANADDFVRYALLHNAGVEQKYWEWRSAIEQIPQDGTQPTNLVLFAGVPVTKDLSSFDQTTVTVANDPMADIVWPDKLSTAARRALDEAKAAGMRFQKAKYELRSSVLAAYYDYALTSELIGLEETNLELLRTVATVSAARNRAGAAGQQDLLKAQNEIDLADNEIARMRSQLAGQRAMLNALLSISANTTLPAPTTVPSTQPVAGSDEEI